MGLINWRHMGWERLGQDHGKRRGDGSGTFDGGGGVAE